MSKRLPVNQASRPPVRLRLPQISLQELKTIRVAIKRKDLPPGATATGPLVRALDDPEDLVLHKPGEGEKPIFDRRDIVVNLDFDERVVLATSEITKPSKSKSQEKQSSTSRSRRSRSHSRHSVTTEYYNRSRSRSNDRLVRTSSNPSKEDSRSKSSITFHKSVVYDKAEATSSSKSKRRSSSKERRRSSSREGEHSKYYRSPSRSDRTSHYESDRRSKHSPSSPQYEHRHRKHSRSPHYKRDHPRFSKSQERRSRSPHRDRDSKYKKYRKRSRSPSVRDRYKSPSRKTHREYSRSPGKYRGPPEEPRRPIPPYQMPPHFGPPWPVYEPMPPYVRFVIPDGYIPAPPLRFPGNAPIRPRLPLKLPVYNSRPIPKIKDVDSNSSMTNANPSTLSSGTESSTTTSTVPTSGETAKHVSGTANPEDADNVNSSKENTDSQSAVTTRQ